MKDKTSAGFKWLLKMAWRDGKASLSRLMLFIASIVLGIMALVGIQSFGLNLRSNIALQSKALMGADYIIDGNHEANEKVKSIIDSLGGENGKEISFASMAAFPKNGLTKLVQIRGIEGPFPFYGALETSPASAASDYQNSGGALVDATLMIQYDLFPGDSIKVGKKMIVIVGSVKSAPGSSSFSSSVAPPVLIPYTFIEETELVQTGSRTHYSYYFLRPDADLEALDKTLDPILDAEKADLDTHTSTSQRLGRQYDNFGTFLNLVAFIALLLGCVGIASSVHIYIKEKLRMVAVLKCIGATRKQTFLIFLIQIAAMGIIGGLLGTILGVSLQQAFPLLVQDLLPFNVEISLAPQAILMGLVLGLFMSVLFALIPLLNTWYVSPLAVLRIDESTPAKSKRAVAMVLGAILLFIHLFSFWLLKDWKFSAAFVAGILVTFALLSGFATLFMRGIKRFFPSSWGFIERQSLLNLFRANNQTMVLILSIGVGSFLISTLYFTKDLLLTRATLDDNAHNPNLLLLDVQTEQATFVIESINQANLPVLGDIPIVTMRVARIKGVTANEIRNDTSPTINQWIINHEFRATYRDSLMASESVAAGKWIGTYDNNALVPISISDNMARDAHLDINDTLVFNVQGVLMETIIGSIRTVDWGRMQMNFAVLFPKGVLENAPQFHVITTKAPDEAASASLQKELVRKFPNVSIIDLRQIVTLVQDILDKIAWVINFMAFFSILTGIIVLIGSVRTSKFQRIKENVLLRTLGAQSKQLVKLSALEYLYLGTLGSSLGIIFSLIGTQLLASLVFEMQFTPSWIPFIVLLPGITLLVLFIGLSNSRSVLNSPPLEVLRKEAR